MLIHQAKSVLLYPRYKTHLGEFDDTPRVDRISETILTIDNLSLDEITFTVMNEGVKLDVIITELPHAGTCNHHEYSISFIPENEGSLEIGMPCC